MDLSDVILLSELRPERNFVGAGSVVRMLKGVTSDHAAQLRK